MAAATRVQMTCATLAPTPTSVVAAGYRIREYEPGDELAWVAIHSYHARPRY